MFYTHVQERYEQYRYDRLKPILSPKTLFLETHEVFAALKKFPRYKIGPQSIQSFDLKFDLKKEKTLLQKDQILPLPDLKIEARHTEPLEKLQQFLKNYNGHVLFTVESSGRVEILKELLTKIHCRPLEVGSWFDFLAAGSPYSFNSRFLRRRYAGSSKNTLCHYS